ncbi:MAG: hypothetical protein AAFP69_11945, partial [Planctomycetota bacterium]
LCLLFAMPLPALAQSSPFGGGYQDEILKRIRRNAAAQSPAATAPVPPRGGRQVRGRQTNIYLGPYGGGIGGFGLGYGPVPVDPYYGGFSQDRDYDQFYGGPIYGRPILPIPCPTCGLRTCVCRRGGGAYVLPPIVLPPAGPPAISQSTWPGQSGWPPATITGNGGTIASRVLQAQRNAAVQQAQRAARPAAVGAVAAANVPANAVDAEIQRRVAALRISGAADRARADRLIAEGDGAFARQRFSTAILRYRDAVNRAGDYPKTQFRLSHGYVAVKKFDLALQHYLIGMRLAGGKQRPGFSMADLYRDGALVKDQHLESLSEAALRDPNDGGLLMLVAIMLHYDGHGMRAEAVFREAARLQGPQQPYAKMFLAGK